MKRTSVGAAVRPAGADRAGLHDRRVDRLERRGFFGERTQADGTIRMDITFRYALARQPG
jgi:hypothetical protein